MTFVQAYRRGTLARVTVRERLVEHALDARLLVVRRHDDAQILGGLVGRERELVGTVADDRRSGASGRQRKVLPRHDPSRVVGCEQQQHDHDRHHSDALPYDEV